MAKKGRPNKIPTEILIKLINRLFYEELHENGKKLTAAEVARYCDLNGYKILPNSITRNSTAMEHINKLREKNDNPLVTQLPIVFKPIDVEALIRNNRNPIDLGEAINEWNSYFEKICDAANTYREERNQAINKNEDLEKKLQDKKKALTQKEEEASLLKTEKKDLETELKAHKKVIEKYVYPAIAIELLKKENKVPESTTTIVAPEVVEETVVTANTNINGSIIDELYNMYKK